VASLETLLNIEAVDKIDPQQRESPPNRELVAQGVGNIVCGLIGGLPVTSVIVRSSVNITSKNDTKMSTFFHGILLVCAVLLVPSVINMIPLAGLAAILLVTGVKLASPKLFKQMWDSGRQQFLPFMMTVAAIVLIDLLYGVLIGLAVSVAFILASNFRRPLRKINEHHIEGDVLRIELGNQVGFFSRPALERALNSVDRGGHVLIDARGSNYIDPDVIAFLKDYMSKAAPAHGVKMSTVGLEEHYEEMEDRILYVDYSKREVQTEITPRGVLTVLEQGNQRFQRNEQLTRDLQRQVKATAPEQAPLAVVLSCIDSRAPTELVFDQGVGDIFTIRIAGNVAREKVLASMEYACVVAGAKLIVVLGHTSCGAITAAVDLLDEERSAADVTGCDHLDVLVEEVHRAVRKDQHPPDDPGERAVFVDEVAKQHVVRTMRKIRRESAAIDRMCQAEEIAIVGGLYDVQSGAVAFFISSGDEVELPDLRLDSGSEAPQRVSGA
jgi:carbonic anhydrase/SulP family sulfate permease